jgi:hypothetical protein
MIQYSSFKIYKKGISHVLFKYRTNGVRNCLTSEIVQELITVPVPVPLYVNPTFLYYMENADIEIEKKK